MQHQKCSLELYTNFLIANQNRYSRVELSKTMPEFSHDHITRWLAGATYTPSDLWRQVKPLISFSAGYLVVDDSLLAKKFSRENELARLQYSGNAHGLVNGIVLEPISKMHLGCNRRISAVDVFSKLIVLPVRIVSAATGSLRNSLDFSFKAIFKIGSSESAPDRRGSVHTG